MMKNKPDTHKISAADIITMFRIAGTAVLIILQPFSLAFFCLYVITGFTDILDGYVARKTKTASGFGARLDSIADMLFYAVIFIRICPFLWSMLPKYIWITVAAVFAVRISAYAVAAVKYRLFASLHTYLNKVTGIAVFLIPFMLATPYYSEYCLAAAVLAALSSLEELIIHLKSRSYDGNIKSIFQKTQVLLKKNHETVKDKTTARNS